MISNKYKLAGDIKRHVDEATNKIKGNVRNNTNQIGSLRGQISQLKRDFRNLKETCKCSNKEEFVTCRGKKIVLMGLSKLLSKIITPEMKKQVFIFLGDKLVYSTKNKLDDKLWASVKNRF
jgi:hypothetical protein